MWLKSGMQLLAAPVEVPDADEQVQVVAGVA